MLALILSIALDFNLPPYFVVAIATVENPTFDATAIHRNRDGSVDRGIMQLNNGWYTHPQWDDPETNIRAACKHIKMLRDYYELTWYQIAIAYNCGIRRILDNDIPPMSLDYAADVFDVWKKIDKNFGAYIGR